MPSTHTARTRHAHGTHTARTRHAHGTRTRHTHTAHAHGTPARTRHARTRARHTHTAPQHARHARTGALLSWHARTHARTRPSAHSWTGIRAPRVQRTATRQESRRGDVRSGHVPAGHRRGAAVDEPPSRLGLRTTPSGRPAASGRPRAPPPASLRPAPTTPRPWTMRQILQIRHARRATRPSGRRVERRPRTAAAGRRPRPTKTSLPSGCPRAPPPLTTRSPRAAARPASLAVANRRGLGARAM